MPWVKIPEFKQIPQSLKHKKLILQIKISEKVYLKDPDTSRLGQKIIKGSIKLLDELGLEHFNFKRLAEEIDSTEASVYRYFENKHKLLIYLTSWYWSWMEYQILFSVNNIASPLERLRIAINILTKPVVFDPKFMHIDEAALHRIVVAESAKAYLTKEVDEDNKGGYFSAYKQLCGVIAGYIEEINPSYPYPKSLISTVIEATHNQPFFAAHLPRLTDMRKGENEQVTDFIMHLIESSLGLNEQQKNQ
jgi:AcrR family transcriptional regulator